MPNATNPLEQTCAVMALVPIVDSIDTSPISTDATTQPKHFEPITERWRRSFLQLVFLQKTHKRNIIAGTSDSDALVTEDNSVLADQLQNAITYINIRKNALTFEELHMLLLGTEDFRQLKICIDVYLSWRPVLSTESNYMIQNQVVDIFTKVDLDDDLNMEDCAAVISHLIARGLDIFKSYDYETSTLTRILRRRRTSDEAVEAVHRWLDLLELAGVGVETYLRVERQRCLASCN
ncbi:unnamed protein product [Fusarium venenatum]|uniref:Uncharacterized protein n=1 Tax=Fusarium venenatum TaxID=56646 RepID=A0A2L2T1R2_9HYPO|nr:uncharacterized protein FVRRES_05839 [Fusarium venenatum]CEI61403.1 unnamed protein product [Fusarium venenatum]